MMSQQLGELQAKPELSRENLLEVFFQETVFLIVTTQSPAQWLLIKPRFETSAKLAIALVSLGNHVLQLSDRIMRFADLSSNSCGGRSLSCHPHFLEWICG